jgi:hypothetical protein
MIDRELLDILDLDWKAGAKDVPVASHADDMLVR